MKGRDQEYLKQARMYWEGHTQAVESRLSLTEQRWDAQNQIELERWKEELAQIVEAESLRETDTSEFELQRYNEEHRLLQETLATRRKIAEEELALLTQE